MAGLVPVEGKDVALLPIMTQDVALLPIMTHDYQDTTGVMLQAASTTGRSQTIIINIHIAIK